MAAIKPDQRLLLDRDRKLERLQEFRKIRKVLLKIIYKICINIQRKSRNAINNQSIQSLMQYKDWLTNCLKPLQSVKYNPINYKSVAPNIKWNKYILRIYISCLKTWLNNYKIFNATLQPMGRKIIAENAFNKMLTDNVGAIQHAVQMLKLFLNTSNNFVHKLKRVPRLNLMNAKYQHKCGKRLPGGQELKIMPNDDQIYLRNLRKLKRLANEASRSTLKLLKLDGSESINSRFSVKDLHIKSDSMQDTAAALINNLIAQKSTKREFLNLTLNLNVDRNESVDIIDNIWHDLVNEHNNLFSTSRKASHIKDELVKFYLTKMQLVLHSQIGKRYSKKRSLSTSLSLRSSVSKSDLKNVDRNVSLQNAHRLFFNFQLKKLISDHNSRTVNKTIQTLYKLIMSDEVPNKASDLSLLKTYERDPHYYNILIMWLNNDANQDASVLDVFERNFERLMGQLAREKRRERMLQMPVKQQQENANATDTFWKKENNKSPIILSEKYLTVERAKWAKYFADQEKTPTMLHLENLRKQKLLALSIQKVKDRVRSQEQKSRRRKRSITAQYTTPRLTHRMREAVHQIAGEALVPSTEHFQRRPSRKLDTTHMSQEVGEEKGLNTENLIADSPSWASCCSKCKNFQEAEPPGPALERFFRAQEQIVKYGKQHFGLFN